MTIIDKDSPLTPRGAREGAGGEGEGGEKGGGREVERKTINEEPLAVPAALLLYFFPLSKNHYLDNGLWRMEGVPQGHPLVIVNQATWATP